MRKIWVWAAVAFGVACQNKGGETSAPAASGSAATNGAAATSGAAAASSPASAAKVGSNGCLTTLDFLVPPQRYGDADLVRAIVVDGEQVYFRNMKDVLKLPLSGGQPATHSTAPGLSLSGTTVLWASGDRLLTQSSGEPIFMAAPKTGGAWSNFIDLTSAKLGGGRDAATRILQGLGGRKAPHASQAAFDGESFFWAETTSQGKGPNAPATSVLKSVPLRGGDARTLLESPGEMGEVVRAGDRIAFMLTAPPTAEQLKQQAAERKTKKFVFGVKGESYLTSVPVNGGEAKKLMRISNFIAGSVLGADGNNVYATGYAEEDPAKPGIYRVDASGASAPERIDQRVLNGDLFVVGEQLVFIGSGMLEHGKIENGQMVLTAARGGKSLTRNACITDHYTLHASAVAGKTALLALFKSDTSLASIAKIPLP